MNSDAVTTVFKICSKCLESKSTDNFYKGKGQNPSSLGSYCKACATASARISNLKKPTKMAAYAITKKLEADKRLRDDFAMAALPVLLGRYLNSNEINESQNFRFAVEDAYDVADKMLKQRG